MIDLKILAPTNIKFFGDLHPFKKWDKQLLEAGIRTEIYFDHKNKNLLKADCVLLHHRYFNHNWKNAVDTATDEESEFVKYLSKLKQNAGKLLWYDADDSSGSTQLPVIPFVDVFVKKQVLKDKSYYTGSPNEKRNLMIWAEKDAVQKQFIPCNEAYVDKIKVGWNIAYIDYRDFVVHYRLRQYLSYFLSYDLFPYKYTDVASNRKYDITFRGTINYSSNAASVQRNKVLELFKTLSYNLASGGSINRSQYLKEINNSKIGISPFGLGEICFRDFETFIGGSLLIKPSMEHLETFPNLYIPNETYLPVSWDLSDLENTLEKVVLNYSEYEHIAKNGQDLFKKTINDPEIFIEAIKRLIN